MNRIEEKGVELGLPTPINSGKIRVFPRQFPGSPDNNGATVAVNRIAACQRPSPMPCLVVVLVRRPVVLVRCSPLAFPQHLIRCPRSLCYRQSTKGEDKEMK
ncbi:hypothetical protein Dimus_010295 [Dionaea muscipula]